MANNENAVHCECMLCGSTAIFTRTGGAENNCVLCEACNEIIALRLLKRFSPKTESEAAGLRACNGCGQMFPPSQLNDYPSGAPDGSTDPYCRACEAAE
jgi:hypothetical protein